MRFQCRHHGEHHVVVPVPRDDLHTDRQSRAAAFDLLGPGSLERDGYNYPAHFLESFKWAIGGGTSEIRRNTIGERVLGLPKGPRPQ